MRLITIKHVILISLLFLASSILLPSCTKEINDENTSQNPVTFTFRFYTGPDINGDKLIYVDFATLDQTVPKVVINGVNITDFNANLAISGELKIPYSSTINYSVTANQKTTEGSITAPSFVNTFTCNNIDVAGGNAVEKSLHYNFAWNNVNCDYQEFYFEYYGYSYTSHSEFLNRNARNFQLSNIDDNTNNFSVSLYSRTGFKAEVGAKANVLGDYGNGFVSAYSKVSRDINIHSILKTPAIKVESHQKFVADFIKVAKQINKQ